MAALLTGLAGCGGVRLQDGSYVVARKGYRVGALDGWTRIEGEADLALRRATDTDGRAAPVARVVPLDEQIGRRRRGDEARFTGYL